MVAWQLKSWDFERKNSIKFKSECEISWNVLSSAEFFLMKPNPGADKGKNKGTLTFYSLILEE